MFDKKKGIFNYLFNLQSVFAALIVLVLIIFNKINSIIYIELLFEEMREGTIYQTIDKNFVLFIKGENIEFITKSINLLNEIALFLIFILVAYYALYFAKQYLAEKGNTNKFYFLVMFILKDRLTLSSNKEGAIKYVFKVILINLPFFIGLILFNNNDVKFLIVIGIIIVYLVFEKIKFKQIQKMLYLNIVISFILEIVIILNKNIGSSPKQVLD